MKINIAVSDDWEIDVTYSEVDPPVDPVQFIPEGWPFRMECKNSEYEFFLDAIKMGTEYSTVMPAKKSGHDVPIDWRIVMYPAPNHLNLVIELAPDDVRVTEHAEQS